MLGELEVELILRTVSPDETTDGVGSEHSAAYRVPGGSCGIGLQSL
jgi:hypothetical protein